VGTVAAQVCSCPPNSPDEGFDRAQYVFTGKVVSAQNHVWFVEVERVWKGQEKAASCDQADGCLRAMDCEFFFELGQRYLFFAVLAKGSREVFYHPQACNWTRRLQSTRVPLLGMRSLWIEELIVRSTDPESHRANDSGH
jgi:hypothetical protein